jgi:uncharacterized protein YutE (UPF0331/DUF86 family)
MEKYLLLSGYSDKQSKLINRIYEEIKDLNLDEYDKRYVFALKLQQLYTAIEDLFKQIAKVFENEIEDVSTFHKELLMRMSLDVPQIRIAVIGETSFRFLDKLRGFRHFIRHGYDYELDLEELVLLKKKLNKNFASVIADIEHFNQFIASLSKPTPSDEI